MKHFSITEELFGRIGDQKISKYTLKHAGSSFEVSLLNYGCIIQSLRVPDKRGNMTQTVLGFNELESYVRDEHYVGCIVGRYANRIDQAYFEIDGAEYNVDANWKGHHLHGGNDPLGKKIWKCKEQYLSEELAAVAFTYLSPEGEAGFPAKVELEIRFTISASLELTVHMKAKANEATPLNLTHHSYFNLNSNQAHNTKNHLLKLYARERLIVNEYLIPNGSLIGTDGTQFDFRKTTTLSDLLASSKGIDSSFVIADDHLNINPCAELSNPENGIQLAISSNLPGMQIYTADYLYDIQGRDGTAYNANQGICIEPQFHPNSPNLKNFPSTLISPTHAYDQQIIYRFHIE